TDGALDVVDCVSGIIKLNFGKKNKEVFVQIEIVLGQPIADRIISILFIYRIHRNLLELSIQQEDLFQTFQRIIQKC
ncbi:unnamed protein product, partial [Rotaria sordida]